MGGVVYWIDLFTRPEFKHVVLESLRYCQNNKGLIVHPWCLMPSYLNMIISSKNNDLSSIIADMKKHTSKQIVRMLDQINEMSLILRHDLQISIISRKV